MLEGVNVVGCLELLWLSHGVFRNSHEIFKIHADH